MIVKCCPHCGSHTGLRWDAWAVWSEEKGFELHNTHDLAWCEDCEAVPATDPIEKEIDDE
jgi:hypothetical protein